MGWEKARPSLGESDGRKVMYEVGSRFDAPVNSGLSEINNPANEIDNDQQSAFQA